MIKKLMRALGWVPANDHEHLKNQYEDLWSLVDDHASFGKPEGPYDKSLAQECWNRFHEITFRKKGE